MLVMDEYVGHSKLMVWSAPDFMLTYYQSLVILWYGVPRLKASLPPDIGHSMAWNTPDSKQANIQI